MQCSLISTTTLYMDLGPMLARSSTDSAKMASNSLQLSQQASSHTCPSAHGTVGSEHEEALELAGPERMSLINTSQHRDGQENHELLKHGTPLPSLQPPVSAQLKRFDSAIPQMVACGVAA